MKYLVEVNSSTVYVYDNADLIRLHIIENPCDKVRLFRRQEGELIEAYEEIPLISLRATDAKRIK